MSVFKKQEGGSHYQSFAIQPAQYSIKNNLPWPEGEEKNTFQDIN